MISKNILRLIKNFAEQNGFEAGAADAQPLELNAEPAPFCSRDIKKRADPRTHLPGAKSVIVIAAPQPEADFYPPPVEKPGRHFAYISSLAYLPDYHIKIKSLLEALAQKIKTAADFNYVTFVDGGFLPERTLAVKAGIAHIAKSGMAFSNKYGPDCRLGIMVTDLELECGGPPAKKNICGKCRICADACKGSNLLPEACVSYITQKKGVLSEPDMEAMKKNVYGCDNCVRICSLNETAREIKHVNLEKLLAMSETEYGEWFGHTAAAWRGRGVMLRNAIIAAGNKKSAPLAHLIAPHAQSPDPGVSAAAAYALKKIN